MSEVEKEEKKKAECAARGVQTPETLSCAALRIWTSPEGSVGSSGRNEVKIENENELNGNWKAEMNGVYVQPNSAPVSRVERAERKDCRSGPFARLFGIKKKNNK